MRSAKRDALIDRLSDLADRIASAPDRADALPCKPGEHRHSRQLGWLESEVRYLANQLRIEIKYGLVPRHRRAPIQIDGSTTIKK